MPTAAPIKSAPAASAPVPRTAQRVRSLSTASASVPAPCLNRTSIRSAAPAWSPTFGPVGRKGSRALRCQRPAAPAHGTTGQAGSLTATAVLRTATARILTTSGIPSSAAGPRRVASAVADGARSASAMPTASGGSGPDTSAETGKLTTLASRPRPATLPMPASRTASRSRDANSPGLRELQEQRNPNARGKDAASATTAVFSTAKWP